MEIPQVEARALADDLSELFGETVHVDAGQLRELGGAKLAIVEMGYIKFNRTHDGPTVEVPVRQTAVVLDDPQLDLPQFTLSPAIKGIAGKIFELLGGVGNLRFDDSPVFCDEYQVQAWNEVASRALFTRAIRDHLGNNPGWSIHGNRNRLVVFRHNQVCPEEHLDEFLAESLKIMALFQESEEQLDERPDIRRDTRPEDVSATAARMGGLVGPLLQSQLNRVSVTREEIEKFINDPIPRTAPAGMKRQVVGDNFMLVIFGAVFFLAGIVAGTLILTTAEGVERWAAIPFGIGFSTIGGLVMFFTIRHRSRMKRILRDGILVEAKLIDVTRTSTEVNGQRWHNVGFDYLLDGKHHSGTANVFGVGVEQARVFQANAQPVRILLDPKDPSRVVCVDLLIIFD